MTCSVTYVGKHSLTMMVSRHSHTDWEIIYCTDGSGVLRFGNGEFPYGNNDILVVPPGMSHENISRKGFTNYHVHMETPMLSAAEPFIVSSVDNVRILPAFSAMFYYYSAGTPAGESMLDAIGNVVMTYISVWQQSDTRNETVLRIEREIIRHYPDHDFDLSGYLKQLPFSEDYLTKLFKKETGSTPGKYLTDLRLRSAMDWLRISGDSSISEIAAMCGFRDPLYFSRVFRKKYGTSPSAFRSGNKKD